MRQGATERRNLIETLTDAIRDQALDKHQSLESRDCCADR